MKNTFKEYPTVFYQIVIITVLAQAVFYFYSFYSTSYSYLYKEIPREYNEYDIYILPFITGLAYIIGGLLSDKVQSVRLGFNIGTIAILIGVILNYLDIFGLFTTNFIVHTGLALIIILSIKHIGILFPVANDWKDNAFLILFLAPGFVAIILAFLTAIISDMLTDDYLNTFFEAPVTVPLINVGILLLLLFLIGRFKDIGYEIEEEEEDLDGDKFITKVMTVLVIISGAFIFKIQFLPALYDPYITGDYTTFDSIGLNNILGGYLAGLLTILFIILMLLRPTYKSTQFKKMSILCWILLGMAIIEVLGYLIKSRSLDNMIQPGYNLIFTIFMVPIFLSIMTHINLNKNLGFWIGLLYAVNSTTPIFFSLPINNKIVQFAPYVAFVMLILFIISFRENRDAIEEKLKLNVSNQGEDDDEDGMDILEHFLEK